MPQRLLLLLLFAATLLAAKERPDLPKAFHAKTYPAMEAQQSPQVAVAADPYDMPDKAAVLVTPWAANDYLPVRLIISNDTDQVLTLTDLRVELTTVNPRAKVQAATIDDLYRRLSRQRRRGDEPQRNPLPIPLPRAKMKPLVKREYQDEIDRLYFKALAIEPHSTASGFVFFDVRDISQPLAGGKIWVSGIRDEQGRELMFFELPMEKYLTYQPGATPTPPAPEKP